jgi:hypothetical protein
VNIFNLLTQKMQLAFSSKDLKEILKISSELGHHVADA